MKKSDWHGVIPAITTPFTPKLEIDFGFLSQHAAMMVKAGCKGIVTPGSLGEGACLSLDEKSRLWTTLVETVGNQVPIIAAVASASTSDAIAIAKQARQCGCKGLMVLPPYLYKGAWRESKAHFAAIMNATDLSCMLYNNPIAYGVDVTPEQIGELAAAHPNLHAVKESSGDVRRVTAIKSLLKDRLAIFVGMDDLIVEGIAAGAVGWIAGLVNALPKESVLLFDAAISGERDRAEMMYSWFLPLLRMDTTYDFVQLIKLVQAEVGVVGHGGAAVRPPRLVPEGAELDRALAVIRKCLKERPRW